MNKVIKHGTFIFHRKVLVFIGNVFLIRICNQQYSEEWISLAKTLSSVLEKAKIRFFGIKKKAS